MENPNFGSCPENQCGFITIYQGYDKSYFIDLIYLETGAPYDLTGVLEIIAAHPPTIVGAPVEAKLTDGDVVVVGSPGAGRIQIKVSAVKSALLQINPNEKQYQDLQISVTNSDSTVTAFILPAILNIVPPSYGVV
jgi:hypothetical protein